MHAVLQTKKKILRKEVKVCVHSVKLFTQTHTRTAQCQHYSVYDIQVQLVQVKIKMLPFVTPVPEPAN